MGIEYAVQCVAVPNPQSEVEAAPFAGAERELGAFLCAVRQSLGAEVARRAANYWIEAFESAAVHSGRPGSAWRRITIAAASRLAQEKFPARFAEKPS